MKTFLLSELFYPVETSTGYFMTKIAEKLDEQSLSGINVICGPEDYDASKLLASDGLKPSVKVFRVQIPRLNKNKIMQRVLRMIILSFGMGWKLFRMAGSNDRVFVVTNPAPILIIVALIKKLLHFNLVIIVHDVFPENMLSGKMIKAESLNYKVLRAVFNIAYKQADKVISVGEDMNELIMQKTSFSVEKTAVIRNWANCDEIFPLKLNSQEIVNYYGIPELSEKVILQFAGNLGRLQALQEFLQVYKAANNSELALVFIGDGALKPNLMQQVQSDHIRSVYFIPSKSREEQNKFLNAAHIGLVSLNQGMYGLGVPSKSYNIWAAGKPILFVGDRGSEIARNIADYDIGWAFSWQEKAELTSFLQMLKYKDLASINSAGLRARQIALAEFDREVSLARFLEV